MKPSRRQPSLRQLELFPLPTRRMTWSALPDPARREVERLLVRMFVQHLVRAERSEVEREANHE